MGEVQYPENFSCLTIFVSDSKEVTIISLHSTPTRTLPVNEAHKISIEALGSQFEEHLRELYFTPDGHNH